MHIPYLHQEQVALKRHSASAFKGQKPQVGIIGASSIDDYSEKRIKTHEVTLPKKEQDRTKLASYQNANIGPIFLTYRGGDAITQKAQEIKDGTKPYSSIVSDDGVSHQFWTIDPQENNFFEQEFAKLESTYVADGHHRTAAAYNLGRMRKEEAEMRGEKITGDEAFNFFMTILYPASQLKIMDYNRVVRSLNGLSAQEFIHQMRSKGIRVEDNPIELQHAKPRTKHEFSLYIKQQWHRCSFDNNAISNDPVKCLDVQLLNDLILDPILGIKNVRSDDRIDFVGGIRGLKELEDRCNYDSVAAFAMHPVTIDSLMDVADSGLIMPPKSTWFEPKPRSGFVVRTL